MVQRIVDDASEIQIQSLDPSAIPRIRTVGRDVFKARAARLTALAASDNPIADYLKLMAALAQAQHDVLAGGFKAQTPSPELMASAQRHSMPLVPALGGTRDPAWRDVFAKLIKAVCAHGDATSGAHQAHLKAHLARLEALDADALDALADALAAERIADIDTAAAPFVMAALQVVWVDLASHIDVREIPYLDTPGLCPVCGSHPVASVVRVGGAYDNYRYLQCGLCATEWHMVRVKCSNCDSTKGIAYHAAGMPDADRQAREAEAKEAVLKAESCDECHTYRKIGYQHRDHDFEPFADDLASLTLDLLMGEAGYRRASPHPWLWPQADAVQVPDES